MKFMRKMMIALSLLLSTGISIAQKTKEVKPNAPLNWYLNDPKKGKVYGVGAEKAYELLKGKTAKEIIVAVIDSGVETDHPDLKDVIWVNKGEVPNNGIDDDKNGYIDDVHGWSFLGGPGGDIDAEALELARMVRAEKKYFEGKTASDIPASDKSRYEKYLKMKGDLDKENAKNQQQYQGVMVMSGYINNVKAASNGVFDKKTNKAYVPKDEMETKIKKRIGAIMLVYPPTTLDKEINNATETFGNLIKMNNMDVDSIRRTLVGDNPEDVTERYYGCNRYEGPDAFHGTHVAGIIAATRGNGIGIEGIASNVKIMVVRAVPNGDERDKDVANAIRYAVDNGAKVINMSFGKSTLR
jgi:subtilisin family serine protease